MKKNLLKSLCAATMLMATSAVYADTYEVLYGLQQADNTVLPQTDFAGDPNEKTDVTFSDANGANCAAAMPIDGSVLYAGTTAGWEKNFTEPVKAGKVFFAGNYTVSPNNSHTFNIVTSTGYEIYKSTQQTTNGNANQVVATICGSEVVGYCRQARKCAYGVKSLVIDLDLQKVTYELLVSSGNNKYTTLTGEVPFPAGENIEDVKGLMVNKTSYGAYLDNVIFYAQIGEYQQKYDYTINYMFNGSPVKTITGKGVEGATIATENVITDENEVVYYTVDADPAPLTIAAEGDNVLNIELRKPYTATLNTKLTVGNQIQEGSTVLTETTARSTAWEYGYPLYMQDADGRYFLCDAETYGRNGEFADGDIINIEAAYSTLADDVVFFAEAENMSYTNNVAMVIGGFNADYTNGHAAAAGAQNATNRGAVVGTLPAGNYTFFTSIVSQPARGIALRSTASADDSNIVVGTLNTTGEHAVDFTLDEETSLVLNGRTSGAKSNQSADFDYVLITKQRAKAATPANPELTGIVESEEYGLPTVQFTVAETDADGNALVLNDNGKLSYQFFVDVDGEVSPLTFTTDLYNELQEDMTVMPADFTDNYDIFPGMIYLNMDISTWTRLGLQTTYAANEVSAKGKVTSTTNQSEVVWVNVGNSTPDAISTVAASSRQAGTVYNLQGQRVNAAQKGLYIVNGRKVVMK